MRSLIIAIVMALPVLASGQQPAPKLVPAPRYTDDWSVRQLDGTNTPLSTFRGRVVFLHFWATWCVNCRPELESIQRLRALVKTADTADAPAFVLISPEAGAIVRRYLGRRADSSSVYLEADRFPRHLQVSALPTTFIIARDGTIAYHTRGAAQWDAPRVLDLLQSLQAQSKHAPE